MVMLTVMFCMLVTYDEAVIIWRPYRWTRVLC